MTSQEDDLAHQQYEEPEVLQAIEELTRDIMNRTKLDELRNGSMIDNTVYKALPRSQRLEVLKGLHEISFRKPVTQVKYRIVWEEDTERLFLIEDRELDYSTTPPIRSGS